MTCSLSCFSSSIYGTFEIVSRLLKPGSDTFCPAATLSAFLTQTRPEDKAAWEQWCLHCCAAFVLCLVYLRHRRLQPCSVLYMLGHGPAQRRLTRLQALILTCEDTTACEKHHRWWGFSRRTTVNGNTRDLTGLSTFISTRLKTTGHMLYFTVQSKRPILRSREIFYPLAFSIYRRTTSESRGFMPIVWWWLHWNLRSFLLRKLKPTDLRGSFLAAEAGSVEAELGWTAAGGCGCDMGDLSGDLSMQCQW